MRDNAFNMKASVLFLESFLVSCFIYALQMITKSSLISGNNIKVLIAKARQTVGHCNHLSTTCEKLKKYPGHFKFIIVNAKSPVLVQNV